MEFIDLGYGIYIYKNVMPDALVLLKDIDDVVKSKSLEWVDATAIGESGAYLDKKFRSTKIISIPYTGGRPVDYSIDREIDFININLGNILYNYLDKYEKDYASKFSIRISGHTNYDMLKYDKDDFVNNHADDCPEHLRRISFVYYFNDDYEGGEINFPMYNISYKPKANEMIVFPSTYTYVHSVSKITDGSKYAIVTWVY